MHAQCQALGARTLCVAMDVAQEPQCRSLVDQALQQFGRIDTLVNNAGVSAQALFEEVKAEDLHWYETLMKVNLWGSVWCTHAALPHLKAVRGRIVTVGSLAGLFGVPGRTAYSASKFAAEGFTQAVWGELQGSGVRVVGIYPYRMKTMLFGENKHEDYDSSMEPEEVARLVVDNIASDAPYGAVAHQIVVTDAPAR